MPRMVALFCHGMSVARSLSGSPGMGTGLIIFAEMTWPAGRSDAAATYVGGCFSALSQIAFSPAAASASTTASVNFTTLLMHEPPQFVGDIGLGCNSASDGE